MNMVRPRSARIKELIYDYALIVVGSIIVGLGANLFFVPFDVVSGGVTGIAIILHHFFERLPIGTAVFLMNIPLTILGWKFAGGAKFFYRTIVAVFFMSMTIDLSAAMGLVDFAKATFSIDHGDSLLLICYGGLLDGLGMGLVFRGRGTTGGTDVLGKMAQRFLGVPIGQSLLAMNVAIFGGALLVFNLKPVMIALALAYVSAHIVDLVQEGFSTARAAMIMTTRLDDVKQAVLERMNRGCTVLHGTGGFTGDDRPVLYVVIGATEVGQLKRLLWEVDRHAFVAIAPAKEVLGEGFAPNVPEV